MYSSPASASVEDSIASSKQILLMRLAHDQEIAMDLNEFSRAEPGSVLEQDDRALGGYPLTALVLDLLTTAAHLSDNLRQLIVVETKDGPNITAPLHGPYSLVRAHLEATSQALWLMAPTARKARIKRCIRHWLNEVKLLNGFQMEWSKSFATPKPVSFEDLRVIAAGASLPIEGFPAGKDWKPAGSGDILKSLEFAHEGPTTTWFNAWQICSGFAHGKQWASMMFNARTSASDDEEGSDPVDELSTSLPVLASLVHEAGLLFDEAAGRYGQLSTTPDAVWPPRH
ncbi:hypothetical protein [Glutamicibacter sp. NPDC087583]|uniref:hypothetical protein n=1 Tax=Glutamicibacter sp. NPDC087583 TaxID=3363995 RepID=UPI00382601A8